LAVIQPALPLSVGSYLMSNPINNWSSNLTLHERSPHLNILFVGVLDVPWSTNIEMKKALMELGHRVDEFNYRTVAAANIPWWQSNAFFTVLLNKLFSWSRRIDWLPLAIKDLYFSILGRPKMHALLREKVASVSYDLLLLLKTDILNPTVIAEISKHVTSWYYFMDPMDLVADKIDAARYAEASTYASATFSEVWKMFLRHNPKSYWMTQGIDPETFFPEEGVAKSIDVMFAGTKTRERDKLLQEIRKRGIKVSCYGVGWENPPVYQSELVGMYRRARIVLNSCRDGSGFSVRVFQVLGTGSFLLSDYCEDLESVFEKGKHLDWAKTTDEMLNKIYYYLEHQKERELIAAEGCSFVHAKKPWKKIMADIIAEIDVGEKAEKSEFGTGF